MQQPLGKTEAGGSGGNPSTGKSRPKRCQEERSPSVGDPTEPHPCRQKPGCLRPANFILSNSQEAQIHVGVPLATSCCLGCRPDPVYIPGNVLEWGSRLLNQAKGGSDTYLAPKVDIQCWGPSIPSLKMENMTHPFRVRVKGDNH